MNYIATEHGMISYDIKPVRYCIELVQLAGEGSEYVNDEPLGVLRVRGEKEDAERLKAGMRQWAVATLGAIEARFGQYEVGLGELDVEGESDGRYGWQTVSWDGERELVPAAESAAEQAG